MICRCGSPIQNQHFFLAFRERNPSHRELKRQPIHLELDLRELLVQKLTLFLGVSRAKSALLSSEAAAHLVTALAHNCLKIVCRFS